MERTKKIYFYFACLLYKLGLKRIALFIAKSKLKKFKFVCKNSFNKKYLLNNHYLDNNPHYKDSDLVRIAKNAKFSMREMPLYMALMKVKTYKKNIKLLDIGGGSGDHFFSIKNEIGDKDIEKYFICEMPYFLKYNEKYKLSPKISYITTDSIKLLENSKIDIINISGTLQIIEKYHSLIKLIKKLKPKFIVLARTPIWELKTMDVLHWMGGESNAVNASRIFNNKEIDKLFQPDYRKLSTDFGSFDKPFVIPFGIFDYKSNIYELID